MVSLWQGGKRMRKWIKVLLALAAVVAALTAVLAKLHLDRERKKELDAFLLPEDEDTVVVDVPVNSEAVQEENEFLA